MNETTEDKLTEIQVSYNVCCAKVGELSYTLHCVQAEIQKLYAELKKYQRAAKKLLEAKSKTSASTQIELPLEIQDAPTDPTKL